MHAYRARLGHSWASGDREAPLGPTVRSWRPGRVRAADIEYIFERLAAGRAPAENRPSGNRARDCAVINWYCERAEQEGLRIRSVRAIFEEGDPIFEASAIRSLSHTQVAVRDPSAILEIEELPW